MAYQPKSYRKFLTGTITAAVVASAVVPAASAAEVKFTDLAGLDAETVTAIEALVGLEVIKGYPDGTFKPNQTINRGQAAEMTVKALKITPKAPTGKVFEDLTDKSYYASFAEALAEAKLIPAGGKFGAGTDMTREAMAIALVTGFGLKATDKAVDVKDLETASPEAREAIKILAQHDVTKLLDGNFNPKEAVKRSQFALFFNRAVAVAGANQSELKVESAKAVDVNKIEVKFNKAVAADVVVDLKKGLVPYNTKATWSEDKKTVELVSSFNLPAGEYSVAVTGVKEDAKVEVKDETATSLVIASTGLEKKDGAALNVTLSNQYGKKMTLNRADFTITAFNATKGTAVAVAADKFTLDLAGAAKDDKVVVALAYKTGLNTSATLNVINEVASAKFAFGEVVLPKDQVRVYAADKDVQVKYTLLDQYDTALTLAPSTAAVNNTISGVTFVSTNSEVVDPSTLKTDKDGNLLFQAGKKGTATLTALVASTGSTSTVTITVADKSTVDKFTVSAPASLVVADENLVLPYVAVDQFGAQILAKDLTADQKTKISFASSNAAVINPNTDITFNSKNELVLNATKEGSATLYVYYNGVLQNNVSFTVQKKAVATRITGVTNLPLLFEASTGASAKFNFKNLSVVDQYNRAYTLDGETIVVEAKDKTANVITLNADKNLVELTTGQDATFAGTATAGTEDFIVSIKGVTGSATEVSMGTVKTADITTYEVTAPTAIKADADAKYVGTLKLVGKTTAGAAVTLATGKVTHGTTSNDKIATVDGLKVTGVKAGTAVIGVWNGATKLAEVTVTISDAAAVPTTVTIDDSTPFTVKKGETVDVAAKLKVLDQYGVDVKNAATGFWTTTDGGKAKVVNGIVSGEAAGEVTIGYVTPNGIVVTTKVTVTE
jgi:trimeric autotransporter adhesin